MSKRKKIITVILTIILVLGVFGVKYGIDFMYYEKVMPTVTIGSVDIASIDNGTYTGGFDAKIIAAEVEVTIESGKILDIKLLKHKYEKGGPATAIVDDIIRAQSLQVDVVSGATNSSKTILKSVENALTNSN